MIKITKEQKDMLWWENWPYSEAKLIFETRILDKKVSRRFISVEVTINPTSYETVSFLVSVLQGKERGVSVKAYMVS